MMYLTYFRCHFGLGPPPCAGQVLDIRVLGVRGGFRRLHAMHSGTRRSAMKAGKTIITQLSPSLRNLLPQWLSFPTNADPHKAWHISPLTCTRELALLNTWTLQTGAHKWYYFQLDACLTAFLTVSVFSKDTEQDLTLGILNIHSGILPMRKVQISTESSLPLRLTFEWSV